MLVHAAVAAAAAAWMTPNTKDQNVGNARKLEHTGQRSIHFNFMYAQRHECQLRRVLVTITTIPGHIMHIRAHNVLLLAWLPVQSLCSVAAATGGGSKG